MKSETGDKKEAEKPKGGKKGKGKQGKEREGERTPGKPITRKCQRLRKETKQAKAIESRGGEKHN